MNNEQTEFNSEPLITMRLATSEDSDFLLNLRNEPDVVATASTGRPVTLDEHMAWFPSALEREDYLILLIEHQDSDGAIGYVRFQQDEPEDAEISVAVSRLWRARSVGSFAIAMGFLRAMDEWPKLERVLAYVRVENGASRRAFEKAGFKLDQEIGPKRDGHHLLYRSRSHS